MSLKDAMKAMYTAQQAHVKATKLDDHEYCQTCSELDQEKNTLLKMQQDKAPSSELRKKHKELTAMESSARIKYPQGVLKR